MGARGSKLYYYMGVRGSKLLRAVCPNSFENDCSIVFAMQRHKETIDVEVLNSLFEISPHLKCHKTEEPDEGLEMVM